MEKWKVKFRPKAFKATAFVAVMMIAAIATKAQDGNAGAPR